MMLLSNGRGDKKVTAGMRFTFFYHTHTHMAALESIKQDLIEKWAERIRDKMMDSGSNIARFVVNEEVSAAELPWIKTTLAAALGNTFAVDTIPFNPAGKAPDCDCTTSVCPHSKGTYLRFVLL
jgi:hypothetical protein